MLNDVLLMLISTVPQNLGSFWYLECYSLTCLKYTISPVYLSTRYFMTCYMYFSMYLWSQIIFLGVIGLHGKSQMYRVFLYRKISQLSPSLVQDAKRGRELGLNNDWGGAYWRHTRQRVAGNQRIVCWRKSILWRVTRVRWHKDRMWLREWVEQNLPSYVKLWRKRCVKCWISRWDKHRRVHSLYTKI